MTPERWQQIKQLCELALEREPAGRAAFLAEVCAADGELRAQVEGLLQGATVDGGVVDSPIWARLRPRRRRIVPRRRSGFGASDRPLPHHPHSWGRRHGYGLRGRAGFSPPSRCVESRPRGLSSREMLKRFERESQALGRLQHPGIAQVYEAGTAEIGRASQPYFAMEFIQGAPLKEYIAANGLDLGDASSSSRKSATRSSTPTIAASSIATSSRETSSSTGRGSRKCSTSVSPAFSRRSPRRRCTRAKGNWSVRSPT